MTSHRIDEALVRKAPQSTEALLELLFEGLDWPRPASMEIEDIPLLNWTPDELHLDPDSVARLTKIQQLPPLTAKQPFGVFILSFDGGRLPVGAVRRVVNQLVRKRRASRTSAKSLWDLNDLIFFCQSNDGVGTLHMVAFRDTEGIPVMKVISWDTKATGNRVELIASESLPSLCWPENGALDVDEWRNQWTSAFTAGYREGIRSAAALATRMADVAAVVRDEVVALYEVETKDGPLRQLFEEVKNSLRADLHVSGFADMYAQTMVYGLLTARITHPEDFEADALNAVLKFENPFLDALYSSFRRKGDQAFDVDDFGLFDLAEVLGKANIEQVLADFGAAERKDDPVVFFYEEFLERYDPDQRRELGTYYTPIPVVRFIVRAVDSIIKAEFGLPLGVADQTSWGDYAKNRGIAIPSGLDKRDKVVRMIDPATGTGTFLLEWMRQAEVNLRKAGRYNPAAMREVVAQMDAFEISLSSYAVAHLKTSLELDPKLRGDVHFGIRLTDTLSGQAPDQLGLFADDPIAREGQRAEQVKFESRHSVVIGNPPYLRSDRGTAGGWIVHPPSGGRSLFDDVLEPARENTIFSHLRSLSNLYVYFWRWAMWKAFEQLDGGPSVVAFITANSWLSGPGFMGLRLMSRKLADEILVIDLGGDNLGARPEENVFDIQIPVSIVILLRKGPVMNQEGQVKYVRVYGSREEKLNFLSSHDISEIDWELGPTQALAPLAPASGGKDWAAMPSLVQLFPWQQPGCIHARTWPVCPSKSTLVERWGRLLSSKDLEKRAKWFVTAKTGRNIHTQVRGLARIADLKTGDPPRAVMRYAYRAFDRQYTFDDPRLAKTESPSLWAAVSSRNVFMVSGMTIQLGNGPAATVTSHLPDFQHFRGSFGGKDVIPLFRDSGSTPNIDPALIDALNSLLGVTTGSSKVHHEQLFAYAFGVLAGTDYTERFRDGLETPGPRIPLTRDRGLFIEMSQFGERLIWLQTFGERFGSPERGKMRVSSEISWKKKPSRIPVDSRDFSYSPSDQVLTVADGELHGVPTSAWNFEVSGMPVIKKWLGYRTSKGAGRAASSDSPLDQIRPATWEPEWSDELREIVHVLIETEGLRPRGTELLDRIMAGELISTVDLPIPPDDLRKPPKTASVGDLFDEDE
jgi:hypothetical protein